MFSRLGLRSIDRKKASAARCKKMISFTAGKFLLSTSSLGPVPQLFEKFLYSFDCSV